MYVKDTTSLVPNIPNQAYFIQRKIQKSFKLIEEIT